MGEAVLSDVTDHAEEIFAAVDDWLGDDAWLCKDRGMTVEFVITRHELNMAMQLYLTEMFIQRLQGKPQPLPPSLMKWLEKAETIYDG